MVIVTLRIQIVKMRLFVFCTIIMGFIANSLEQEENSYTSTVVIDKVDRSFTIDFETNQFLLDGKPFRYVSGSVHYFRMPSYYWRDRLTKLRAAGLNAVQTYVEWSQHEPSPGVYNFNGDLDLIQFIELAQELGLLVILRPGPYICAERDFGGYPPWLLTLSPGIRIRTSDKAHKTYVERWFDVLMPKIVPLLYGNGGPIIMVQVENEYGSYFACDTNYTIWLRDLFRSYVKNDALLFTTDGAGIGYLKCGAIPGVFSTVDFGSSVNVSNAFESLQKIGQLRGPLVNSEYYSGWLTHWNERFQSVPISRFITTLKEILDYRGNITSVNLYMFYGGTNFGFMAGANCGNTLGFQPQLTSYDYDSPITEAGDLTDKYFALKSLLLQYFPDTNMKVKSYTPKSHYGVVKLEPIISIFNYSSSTPSIKNMFPLTFADINHHYGFVLYKHKLEGQLADPSQLYVPGVRDRAIVFVDEVPVAVISRFRNIFSVPIKARAGQTLSLLVENEGRINYGTYMKDPKGIVCQVLLNGMTLLNWEMVKIPLNNISNVESIALKSGIRSFKSPPGFYSSSFQLKDNETLGHDTYLNLQGWGKGVAFINGFNIGRYWVDVGSQVTLYVPGKLFKLYPNYNKLTILELEYESPTLTAVFQDKPIINSSVPILGSFGVECQMKCRPILH